MALYSIFQRTSTEQNISCVFAVDATADQQGLHLAARAAASLNHTGSMCAAPAAHLI